MIDFTNCKEELNSYKGSEKKKTLIYEGKKYLVKFPDPIREKNKNISYINNAFSEYIGSNIFKMAGFPTQNTILGIYKYNEKEKIVCACEDFTDLNKTLYEFENLALSTNPDKKIETELKQNEILNGQIYYLTNENKELKKKLDSKRPISKETLQSLRETINLEWTYNSNGIEGNTLTLRETQVVLEGITVGGKSVKEHLEAINHEKAILYLEDLVKDNKPITEWNIKNIHQLILKGIDDENAGRYRRENVTIKGATHIPPDYIKIPELMEKLILNYETWNKYHPIIQAALLHGELVKIHPFVDGNGRTSRLIMNLDLMNHGYNPVIIKKADRLEYYEALDKAHTTMDYTDFVKLINKLEIEMLNKYLELL